MPWLTEINNGAIYPYARTDSDAKHLPKIRVQRSARHVEVRQAAPELTQDMSKYREQKVDLNDPHQQAAAAQDTREQPRREPIRTEKTVGRNDPCPCGSGKKFKNCHGRNA